MTKDELLGELYDKTLTGNAPAVLDLTNQGLGQGLGQEQIALGLDAGRVLRRQDELGAGAPGFADQALGRLDIGCQLAARIELDAGDGEGRAHADFPGSGA